MEGQTSWRHMQKVNCIKKYIKKSNGGRLTAGQFSKMIYHHTDKIGFNRN